MEKIICEERSDEGLRTFKDNICGTIRSEKESGGDKRVIEVNRLGNIYGEDKGTGFAGNVWDDKGLCPTITTMQGGNREPMIVEDFYKNREPRVYDETAPTIRAERNGIKCVQSNYRIRKLTPKECAKLMKFSDEDANKMLEVNSNTQAYKQCGNSIVVSVLEAIFCQMNIKSCPTWEERAKEEYL